MRCEVDTRSAVFMGVVIMAEKEGLVEITEEPFGWPFALTEKGAGWAKSAGYDPLTEDGTASALYAFALSIETLASQQGFPMTDEWKQLFRPCPDAAVA